MIRFPVYNPITSVNLLQQNHPHQLMGKRHPGKAQCIIRSVQYRPAQTNRASDHKLNMTLPLYTQAVDLLCQFFRSQLLSFDFQRNHIGIFPDVL